MPSFISETWGFERPRRLPRARLGSRFFMTPFVTPVTYNMTGYFLMMNLQDQRSPYGGIKHAFSRSSFASDAAQLFVKRRQSGVLQHSGSTKGPANAGTVLR